MPDRRSQHPLQGAEPRRLSNRQPEGSRAVGVPCRGTPACHLQLREGKGAGSACHELPGAKARGLPDGQPPGAGSTRPDSLEARKGAGLPLLGDWVKIDCLSVFRGRLKVGYLTSCGAET